MATTAPTPSRSEKLAAQRDAFLSWARTATTDEPPAELPAPAADEG